MTYFGFLAGFLGLPLAVLAGIHVWDARRKQAGNRPWDSRGGWFAIALHLALAVAYTTPWDNYLVATGVWHYNPRLVSGGVLGWVPVEEYLFFILETLLAGLWWMFLSRRLPKAGGFKPSRSIRTGALAVLGLAWLVSVGVLISGWKPGTYLALILFWALPALAPQAAYGADILWRQRRFVALAVLPLFIYLALADSMAIASGTWRIDPAQSTGVMIGPLPLEEALFFLFTVVLVTFGMTLALSSDGRERWRGWVRKYLET